MRVAGHSFALEATTASQWLGAIAVDPEGLAGVMPGLIADDDLEAMEAIMSSHPDIDRRWINAARMALQRAGGRDWWWTLNLSRQALGAWIYINGMLLRQNIDSARTGLPDWLDACYTMLWERGKEEDRTKLDLQLSMRPKGVGVRQTKAAIAEMTSAFAAD